MAEENAAAAGMAGRRLDVYVAAAEGVTRSAAARLIESGAVTVNGEVMRKNYILREGDIVEADIPEPDDCEAAPENIPLDVVYEDDDVIVINKPSGMVVHPAPGNESGTLVNALLYHCGGSLSGVGGVLRPGIVHRIDKDTSGLLVAAKNDFAHNALSEQMKSHGVSRVYLAIVVGGMKVDSGVIDAPIGRSDRDRKKMAVSPSGHSRSAVTHYEVAERFRGYTLLRVVLETGRTHQIRVHMSALGHPVVGDPLYGGDSCELAKKYGSLMKGQCLHAASLTFRHPRTGDVVTFEAPPPEDFNRVLDILRERYE
jgi:23S rRNA pseudouridine1911/1915/1917 synthase